MQKSGLIDYSIFLVEVNSTNVNSNNLILKAMVYSVMNMGYVVKDIKNSKNQYNSAETKFGTVQKTTKPSLKTASGFKILQSRDGSTFYKIGIIDFLTLYDNIKFMENQIKSKIHRVDKKEVSATDPATYKERFDEFMQQYF